MSLAWLLPGLFGSLVMALAVMDGHVGVWDLAALFSVLLWGVYLVLDARGLD